MWFKNLQLLRLTGPFPLTAAALEEKLAPHVFAPCGDVEMTSQGWVSPRDNGQLVHTVNGQLLIALGVDKKLLPASVIKAVLKARAAELEEQQGFAPGRKQMKELKETVTDELMPRAFSTLRTTHVWIDPVNRWIAVDAASPAKMDEVLKLLLKSIDQLPIAGLRPVRSPVAAMTDWLASDEAPGGFTVDQDTELRATGESKATVRYVRHTIEAEDVRRHIAAGKQATKLAMTWGDKISFVLDATLTIKRIAPLDVLKEKDDAGSKNADERFDGDFLLMTGELAKLLDDLIEALGGEGAPEKGQLDIDDIPATGAADAGDDTSDDALYERAVTIVRAQDRASISLVQRHLRIGYNRAARLIDQMEQAGLVSAMDSSGSRTVLTTATEQGA